MEQLSYTSESLSYSEEGAMLTFDQRASLRTAEQGFMTERRSDGDARWHRFFEAGVRDEQGAVWAVYNDIWHENLPEGWQLWYCPPGQDEFDRLIIDEVIRTDISRWHPNDKGCMATVQLDVGNDHNRHLGMVRNDRLNMLFYEDEPPVLRFWNHSQDMELIPTPSLRLLGGRAVEQLVELPGSSMAA